MTVRINGVSETMRALRKEMQVFEKRCVDETRIGARVLMQCLFDQTPVWEGTAVRNYVVGVGRSPGGGEKPAAGGGDPGPTGTMGAPPAGEPRRAANESAALGDMEAALRGLRKLTNLSIGNTAHHFDLIEHGSAPTPDRARNPGGVSNIAMMKAKGQLGNFK